MLSKLITVLRAFLWGFNTIKEATFFHRLLVTNTSLEDHEKCCRYSSASYIFDTERYFWDVLNANMRDF